MIEGAQRSWSGRGAVEAGLGDVITVNPGEVHDGAPIGEARAWSMLYLAPSLVGSIVADMTEGALTTRELHAPVVTDVRLARLFKAARTAVTSADPDDGAGEANLILLFAALLQTKPRPPPRAPRRLALVKERIDDDPAATHPLEELAWLAGLSRFQAIRGFVRLTGFTPHGYVIQRRLDFARRLVRDGSALAAAAAEAGFADQSHFHRAFVARYGLTPGSYAAAVGR